MPDLTTSAFMDSVMAAASRSAAAILLGIIGASTTETRSADFTVDYAKPGAVYAVTAGGSGVTITASAATAGDGFLFAVRKADSSAGDVIDQLTNRLVLRDEYVVYRSNGTTWKRIAHEEPAQIDQASGVFGTYGDGDVTISSGTTTFVRDMHYRKITVTGSSTQINHACYAMFFDVWDISGVTGTSSFGTASVAGGSSAGPAAGTSAALTTSKTLHHGVAGNSGGAGGTGVSVQPTNTTSLAWLGGSVGAGGAGGTGTSGAGLAARLAVASAITRYSRSLFPTMGICHSNALAAGAGAAGQAGTSGAGDGTNSGGGGGGSGKGGHQIWIAGRKIVSAATVPVNYINAKGSNGGNGGPATSGNCGGGGGAGGGGGGYVTLIYGEIIGAAGVPVDLTGGNGGNGGVGFGTGTAGGGASGGASGYAVRCNSVTGVWTDYGTPGSTNSVVGSGATGGTATTTQYLV